MSEGLKTAALNEMDAVMAGLAESEEVPGIVALISRGDEAHVSVAGRLSIGGPPVTRDSIFRIASISKPVTAVAAMTLVEEGKLRLDDPVDEFLPELANRRVLRNLEAELDDTAPAKRAITARDLLTMCFGMGHIMWENDYPIQRELNRLKLLQGPPHPREEPPTDEWIAKVGSLPLMFQPGEKWLYDLSIDVLGVLVARVAGKGLDAVLKEKVFGPLGMVDTAFYCPPEKLARLVTNYEIDEEKGGLKVYDEAEGGEWTEMPKFPSGAGGLVSTVDDLHKFGRMVLNGGELGGVRILSAETVGQMTQDQVSAEQKVGAEIFMEDGGGWGFGMAVNPNSKVPGGFGWDGGLGTSWYADPRFDLTGVLLTQVSWTSPVPPKVREEFWRLAYLAVEGN